jgi:hypothetical protein
VKHREEVVLQLAVHFLLVERGRKEGKKRNRKKKRKGKKNEQAWGCHLRSSSSWWALWWEPS